MRVRIKVGGKAEDAGWSAVKIFGLIVVLGALVSSSTRGVVKPPQSVPKTVIPAAIRAARVDAMTVPFGARVKQVFVAPGAAVKMGDLLVILESEDVEREVERAQGRLMLAERRSATRGPRTVTELERLQARTATRSLDLARKRVAGDSVADAEAAYAAAKDRREKLARLVAERMVTATEMQAAEREEQNESRNLKAAQEHHSRLEQEVEAYETQVAVFQSQAEAGAAPDLTGSGMEIAEARSAVAEALRRREELQVKAMRDGVVLSSIPSVGDRIFAGASFLHVADVSRLSFDAPVSAVLARQIRPGTAVRLRIPTDPPRQVDAEVSSVAMAPDPVQQSYVVRAVISNPDRNVILVGMEGAMEFPHSESLWRRLF